VSSLRDLFRCPLFARHFRAGLSHAAPSGLKCGDAVSALLARIGSHAHSSLAPHRSFVINHFEAFELRFIDSLSAASVAFFQSAVSRDFWRIRNCSDSSPQP
jgi:hypothetical protein